LNRRTAKETLSVDIDISLFCYLLVVNEMEDTKQVLHLFIISYMETNVRENKTIIQIILRIF
jgi:hypothetical protein